MGDLDSSVIKRTQQTLGKYVKKPPLTEKLLTKPPFRFLHDVFNAVIKETGCFVGLYTPEELNSDNIKDRDGKMGFLQKMIDVIKITSNKPLTVRTSKIVAGQEPEKTNELLQLMGEVIEKKLDWKSAVEQVLNGKEPEATKSTTWSKSHDKAGDKKNKDKSNEKSKDKENRAKDTKRKDIKKIGKTTSPPVKSDKTSKKSTEDREKVNVGRATKSQVAKGAKDKNEIKVEKVKSSKEDKPVFKEKAPSPVKVEASEVIEAASNITNNNSLERESIEMESKTSDKPNENISIGNSRRNSKSLGGDALLSASPILLPGEAPSDQVKTSTPTNSDAGSRKPSGKRKKSAGNNRRLSATVAHQNERKTPIQEFVNNIKDENDNKGENSLRKVSSGKLRNSELLQEEQQQDDTSLTQQHIFKTKQISQSPIHSPAPPPTAAPPTAAQPIPHEVRRESTFTRENSRDSNNSNAANRPRTSLRPPSARPASARPGAPRRRDRNIEIVLQPNDQVKMSGINVKLESFGDLDDDGENLVVIEDANSPNIGESVEDVKSANESNIENNLEQQGHLVQQILETQKELMQQNVNSAVGKSDKDVDLANSLTGRQSSARQMNNLRDIIQNLTKSVNPFGKLMDFIPEDIDAMQLELTMWRDTYTQVANELRREKSLTESATEPMKNQLLQIEASIKEFTDMIDASRTKILQNSQKILKMLAEQ